MNFIPKYHYPVGTEVTLFDQKMALNATTDDGYVFTNMETGEVGVTSFSKFIELMKSPAMRIGNSVGMASSVMELRLGNMKAAEQLAVAQQENGQFNHAVSAAAAALRTKLRADLGKPNFKLTGPLLNEVKHRKFICDMAGAILGSKIYRTCPRGGKSADWFLCTGRTIIKYLNIYDSLGPDDDPIAALATRDHLKGNNTRRIPHKLLLLMTEAWEEIGLDLKGTSVSNVHDYLTTLIHEENKIRRRNCLKGLPVPSQKTLKIHREFLQNPTEYLVAVKGERHARNKRGRGSSDIRALFPGELVEIDECRLSLISSAKERGYWENLSSKDKMTAKEIDALIKRRLTLLIMIDVATRIPLAWVISDNPKAEATLALLRMATRDKTKDKVKYGCDGDPAPAMGIGSVKSDNGVGLRNKKVIQALLGTSASFTAARTYASADKPYVERVIGTTESMLIKLIHGYTGRKAGELPGYDSKENGVLDIDELYGIITKFFIDEYPSLRHMGIGMGGRRPAEVIKELNETRNLFKLMDEDQRRIHLGWKVRVTPNDEGVCVFSGLWFNSDRLQYLIDDYPGIKISVFIDPENVNEATAVIPGVHELIRLQLQITAFADLTIPEVLELTQAYRLEDPEVTEMHEDRIASTRRKRFDLLRTIGVEHDLSRSHSTFEECRNKARHIFGGARVVKNSNKMLTVRPGEINSQVSGPGVFQLGNGDDLIEHEPIYVTNDLTDDQNGTADENAQATSSEKTTRAPKPEATSQEIKQLPIGRPKTKGSFA